MPRDKNIKLSHESRSHPTVPAGRRKVKGTGQGSFSKPVTRKPAK